FVYFAVLLLHRQLGKHVVADSAIGREHLAENHDATISFGKKLRLKVIEVNQTLRGFSLPIGAPFFEILPGKLLKNEAAEHIIAGRLVEIVWRAHIVLRLSMLQRHI